MARTHTHTPQKNNNFKALDSLLLWLRFSRWKIKEFLETNCGKGQVRTRHATFAEMMVCLRKQSSDSEQIQSRWGEHWPFSHNVYVGLEPLVVDKWGGLEAAHRHIGLGSVGCGYVQAPCTVAQNQLEMTTTTLQLKTWQITSPKKNNIVVVIVFFFSFCVTNWVLGGNKKECNSLRSTLKCQITERCPENMMDNRRFDLRRHWLFLPFCKQS